MKTHFLFFKHHEIEQLLLRNVKSKTHKLSKPEFCVVDYNGGSMRATLYQKFAGWQALSRVPYGVALL